MCLLLQVYLKQPDASHSILVVLAGAKGASMSKLWHKVKHYCHTHDDIEMLLLSCMLGSLGWMAYHAITGIIERIIG